jgi:signal transduction histidine kinase
MGLTETADGRIWAATGGGLGEFNGASFILHESGRDFPSNRLFAIESDAEGTVWVATEGSGVVRFRDGKARAVTSREGMPTDKILSLVDDGAGKLWFGTVRGAFSVDKRELHAAADGRTKRIAYTFFDENDGLGSRQCNGAANPSALRTNDGRVWLATAHGISMTAASAPVPPPAREPIVERVSVNGREVPLATLANLSSGADRIEFEFSGLSLASPDRIRYRYRLTDYDDTWIDAGTSRIASYTRVPPGEHEFVVSSSRDGARWTESRVALKLAPRFYETKWFIALCLTAFAALLYALHTLRLRITHERARELERIVEERTRQISEEKERTEAALRESERQEQLAEQALAEAEDANRAKSVFLATTSHELRTPLNAIIGFSDILIGNISHQIDSRQVAFLHNIHSSGEYLLGIINNILDLSKVEAGRMELHPETILLRETVNGIAAVMKGVTTLRSITIEVEIPDDLPMFEADAAMLKQILYNLMSNAVKFSPEHATVTVSARAVSASESPLNVPAVEVQVSDRGIGIDPKDQQIIFEEFRQAGRGKRQGTGLGLALVKRFVELHGGSIRVESEPGMGSTFTFVLPRLRAPHGAVVEQLRGSLPA